MQRWPPRFRHTETAHLCSETSYDWKGEQWLAPVNLMAAQLLAPGGQPLQLLVGGRYYVAAPAGGPDWGLRVAVTLLFPK